MSNINTIRLSGTTYQIEDSNASKTVELTQAQYDALVDKDPNTFYVITDAEAGDLTNYYTKSETNTLLGDKADTATTYTKTEVDTALASKQTTLTAGTGISIVDNVISATGGSSITVDTSLDSNSTNPVQNQALYNELVINGGTTEITLTFEGTSYYYSTNYPSGCTEVKVTVPNWEYETVYFLDANDSRHGYVEIDRMDGESININVLFDGASYSIDNNEVVISYPSVTDVSKVQLDNGETTVKAVVTQTIHLKDQVATNATALGGLSLVKLTQAEYNALSPNYDSNTLYVIVN
jgi:hypothetical protein